MVVSKEAFYLKLVARAHRAAKAIMQIQDMVERAAGTSDTAHRQAQALSVRLPTFPLPIWYTSLQTNKQASLV